jgi:hypothetical protein
MGKWNFGDPPKEKNILIKAQGQPFVVMDYEPKIGWMGPAYYREIELEGPVWWARLQEPKVGK